MRKKLFKKSKIIVIIVITILALFLVFVLFLSMMLNRMEQSYDKKMDLLKKEISSSKRIVYVATDAMPIGTIITEDNTVKKEIISNQSPSMFITKDDFNKRTVINILKKQPITVNMVSEDFVKGLREVEYNLIHLNSNLRKDDFVDIRILLPNGENYIVLSKKLLQSINLENNYCRLWLNEEEIMQISSAIVDIYMHQGATLYTTKYIDDNQYKSSTTYQPSKDVMLAMSNDPNIIIESARELNLKVRQEIESRLSEFVANEEYKNGKEESITENIQK